MNTLLRMMVENNKDIVGARVAFEPFYRNQSEKYYAFYYFRKNDKVEFRKLGSDQYVYFYMDWYEVPRELGKPLWSEP